MLTERVATTIVAVATVALPVAAQYTDKAAADSMLYAVLSQPSLTENWHQPTVIADSMLVPTAEQGVFIVRGESFQVKSLSSAFYVRSAHDGSWQVINDSRYPLETTTNLLLNRLTENKHQLRLRHHQYGGHTPIILMPMQNIYDQMAPGMDLYCSVTAIDSKQIKAIVVFHHRRLDFIHLIQVSIPTARLTEATSTIEAELYSNIPQSNIKSLFNEHNQ